MSEKKQNQEKISQDILNKVKNTHQRSKKYFLFRDFLLGFGIGIFLLLSMFSVAIFIYDVREIKEFYDYFDKLPDLRFVGGLLFEFLVIAALGGVLIYYVYRKTDWILVKYKPLLVLITSVIILTGGFFIYAVLEENEKNPLSGGVDALETLPFRQQRDQDVIKHLEEEGLYVGIIRKINKESIVVENRLGSKVFNISREGIENKNLKIGQFVSVKHEESRIINIKVVQKPNPNRFAPQDSHDQGEIKGVRDARPSIDPKGE